MFGDVLLGHTLLGDALLGHTLLGHALLGDVLLGHTMLCVENCRLPLKHAKGMSLRDGVMCLFGFGGFGMSKMCFGVLAIKVFA